MPCVPCKVIIDNFAALERQLACTRTTILLAAMDGKHPTDGDEREMLVALEVSAKAAAALEQRMGGKR